MNEPVPTKLKSLKGYGILAQVPHLTKIDDIAGRPVTIKGFVSGRGRYSDQYYCSIDIGGKEDVTLPINDPLMMQALEEVQAAGGFPVTATFIKEGSVWTVN